MIPELGHFAMILALAMALAQSVLPLIGAQTGSAAWMSLARPSARGQFLFVLMAYGCLTAAFINNDFSVLLAANHSNSTLPLIYRITAVWGNHEGSILLWSLILSGWTLAVSIFSKQLDDRTVARVLGVMGLVKVNSRKPTLISPITLSTRATVRSSSWREKIDTASVQPARISDHNRIEPSWLPHTAVMR